jgi:protein required for attachment to host cells
MTHSTPTTWILIMDAAHADVFAAHGARPQLSLVPGMTLAQHVPAGKELTRERPNRTHESSGTTRHAIEAKEDPRRAFKRAFANEVAERLNLAAVAKAFDQLIVAAPPQMLGDLRTSFSRAVTDRIIKEIPKDLVKIPRDDLLAHLDLPLGR